MRHDLQRRPEEIEAEIARTRGDMNATLSAIEQRLTPGQLVDQGLAYVRHSGANEFVSNLGGSVKNNPIPVALMGIGMAWLMATGNRGPSYVYPQTEGEAGTSGAGMMQRASGGLSSTKETLSSAKASTKETLWSAKERLSGGVGQAGQAARSRMEQMRRRAERVRSGYDSIVREQPLVLGAIGLAVGAMLGAGLPRTREEDELMGEASDRLTERAKEAGKERLEQAKEAGKEQLEKAKEAMKEGGPPEARPAGKPNVVEPARATPAGQGATPRDPRLGRP